MRDERRNHPADGAALRCSSVHSTRNTSRKATMNRTASMKLVIRIVVSVA